MKRYLLFAVLLLFSLSAAADSLGSQEFAFGMFAGTSTPEGALIGFSACPPLVQTGGSPCSGSPYSHLVGSNVGIIHPSSLTQTFTIDSSDPNFQFVVDSFINPGPMVLVFAHSFVDAEHPYIAWPFTVQFSAIGDSDNTFSQGELDSLTLTVQPFDFTPFTFDDGEVLYKVVAPDGSQPTFSVAANGVLLANLPPPTTNAPEPSTAVLLMTGLLCVRKRATSLLRQRRASRQRLN